MRVDEITAMNLSAVWNAVLIKGNTVGVLPLILYRRKGNIGKERFVKTPLYSLLHDNPNPNMTAFQFKRTLQLHYDLLGNAYAQIIRNDMADPIALYPLNPGRVEMKIVNNQTKYLYRTDEKTYVLDAQDIFHLPNLSWDGRLGYNVIQVAARSLGLALAQDEYASRFFSRGATPTGVLTYPGKITDRENTAKNLRESWDKAYSGPGNAHKIMILEHGFDYKAISLTPEESQLLGSKLFSIQEVARWFNIPVHKLKEHSRSTYNNIDAEQLNFYTDCIMPLLVHWEETVNWKLIRSDQRDKVFAEFLVDAILRGDPASRNSAYATQRMWGIISQNEWRAKENLNLVEDAAADEYVIPMNYMSTKMLLVQDDVGKIKTDLAKEAIKKDDEEVEDEEEEGDGEGDEKEENKLSRSINKRSLASRYQTQKRFVTLFKNVGSRIVTKDVIAIKGLARKEFEQNRKRDFKKSLDAYYASRYSSIRTQFMSVYKPYSELISESVLDELKVDKKDEQSYNKRSVESDLNKEVNKFVDVTTKRYIDSSKGQLNKIVDDSIENEEDIIDNIDDRMDEWLEKRPEKIGFREAVDGNNGLSVFLFFLFNKKAMWVASGKSCPYCTSLDGRIISQGSYFVDAKTGIEVEGKDTLFPSSNISHPQAHGGCDCGLVPV